MGLSAYLYAMPNQLFKYSFSLGKQMAVYIFENKRIYFTESNRCWVLALVPT